MKQMLHGLISSVQAARDSTKRKLVKLNPC